MAMTPEQLDALVQRLERYARQHPAQYRLRVAMLAALGYGYIFLVFVLLVGMVWGVRQALASVRPDLGSQLDAIAFLLILGLIQSLWMKYSPPTGIALHRQDLPELFAVLDKLTMALQAPVCHHVLLTTKLNAGVLQIPRLGFLGWQKNYLLIGLPLMQAVSPEQFEATLAHELAHLSGNHSRFAGWIYRIRHAWAQLSIQLQADEKKSFFLFKWFFSWYEPFFNAYSFVLARADEYAADRWAAELAGVQVAADELINIYVKSHLVADAFWPEIYQQARFQPEPPAEAIAQILQALRQDLPVPAAHRWLERAMSRKTDNEDTHPCLADRLSAFGYNFSPEEPLPLPAPLGQTAAEYFLGGQLPQLVAQLNAFWYDKKVTDWQKIHQGAQQRRQKLAKLQSQDKLTVEESWHLGKLTQEFQGGGQAIPLFQQLLARQPAHPGGNYGLGKLLLNQENSTGIGYLEVAIAGDPSLAGVGCRAIADFLHQKAQTAEARAYEKKGELHQEAWQRWHSEREGVSELDKFTAHNLPDDEIQQLAQQLSDYPEVKEAYLGQKVVLHFPEKPVYVLGIVRRFVLSETGGYLHDEMLIAKIENQLSFSGTMLKLILDQKNLHLKKTFRRLARALIHQYS